MPEKLPERRPHPGERPFHGRSESTLRWGITARRDWYPKACRLTYIAADGTSWTKFFRNRDVHTRMDRVYTRINQRIAEATDSVEAELAASTVAARPGRPKGTQKERKASVNIRMTGLDKYYLKLAAKRNKCTMADYVRRLIEDDRALRKLGMS